MIPLRALDPRRWPLAVRVPLIVAALVAGVALATGQAVLSRLARDQERHLSELASAFLDGLATAVQPAAARADIWEAFDALDRARARYGALRPMLAAVLLPDGTVLASADPRSIPTGSRLPAALATQAEAAAAAGMPVLDAEAATAVLARDLAEGAVPLGRIVAMADIGPLLVERRAVVGTLLLANGSLALVFAAAGFLLVRRLLAPADLVRRRLAEAARGGRPVPVDETLGIGPEHAALLAAWNRAAVASAEREAMAARLAKEERHAQVGRLAAAMAHEVNNPLGGLITAVDTLSDHGDDPEVRAEALGLLRRGLGDIRNVVRAGLATWRGAPGDAALAAQDFDDLRLLVRHEVARRGLTLEWRNELPGEVAVDRTLGRQVALNLLLNAAAASPPQGTLRFRACELQGGGAVVEVADAGPGLPAAMESLLGAAEGPPPEGGGLGLWTAVRLARSLGGRIIRIPSDTGTRLVAELPAASARREAAHAI
ncbi:HAMP domain-containing histidine kinase [Roseomonas frigidaquae]|uniref:histidine kinase n=1 Tax=Falsiroseomonas frigidaquae TaxID=487318 RepID=A0ABX1EVX3_9PROT|nr:HAMP domain-containing histidine kinase [Falsiroseomonas frigidaquae]NKE43445.1 HAMP domain-containing histidine kinase [Falsiroseomonas frigidaquae]